MPCSLPRRLDLVRTLPAEWTDNQFVHSVYCINQCTPSARSGFWLLPANLLQQTFPRPPTHLDGSFLRSQPHVLAESLALPGPWRALHMAPTLQLLWELGNLAATQGPALCWPQALSSTEELSPALSNNRFLILPSRCLCCKPRGATASHLPNMFQFLQKGSDTSVKRWNLQGGALF